MRRVDGKRSERGLIVDLASVKREESLLLAVLNLKQAGKHLHCPFHEDKNGSFSVWQDTDGAWLWKCWSGCGTGTIIDAAMKVYGVSRPVDALRKLEEKMGVRMERNEEIIEPRIDKERAERLVAAAHQLLMSDFEIRDTYLLGKRGIGKLDVVRDYRLGFIRNAQFKNWGWKLTGWVLPVTDPDGALLAVKIHTEMKRDQYTKNIPKCLWAPFGTYPAKEPKHAAITLWPPPERWPGCDILWLCPGELKALTIIDKGQPATSSTAGEGSPLPPRLVNRIKRVSPRLVCLSFDNDATGKKWRDQTTELLQKAGLTVQAVDLSKKAEAKQPLQPKPTQPPPVSDLDKMWMEAKEIPEHVDEEHSDMPWKQELDATDHRVLRHLYGGE